MLSLAPALRDEVVTLLLPELQGPRPLTSVQTSMGTLKVVSTMLDWLPRALAVWFLEKNCTNAVWPLILATNSIMVAVSTGTPELPGRRTPVLWRRVTVARSPSVACTLCSALLFHRQDPTS